MKISAIVFTIIFLVSLPLCISAQLSEKAIDALATTHVDKWAQYLNLSKYRKAKLKDVWRKHEQKKSDILRYTNDIKDRLHEENLSFMSSLNSIFSRSELDFYKSYQHLKMKDDRAYLINLVEAISSDSLFIEAYTDLQYRKIFPFKITVRMEMEEVIKRSDKNILDSIRAEVFEHYDKCLITCLSTDSDQPGLFENFDELIIVALNKDLNDSESGLSQLIKLTHKYEEAIHGINIKHKERLNSLELENTELKRKYVLDSHNESLLNLRKLNGLSTLKHLESEAIFLLLDPYDHNVSRKLFNLDLYNRL